MKCLVGLALFLSVITSPLYGVANYLDELTRLGSSAQMIGGANIEGFGFFSNSVFENPAALYRINRYSGTYFTTTLMDEVNYNNLSMAFRLKNGGVLAIGYMNSAVTDIPVAERIFLGLNQEQYRLRQIGSFSYNSSMVKVAYQFSQTRHLHFGITGAFYNKKIGDIEGIGYNVDLGMILESDPLTLSVSARNIISSLGVDYTDPNERENSSDGQQEVLALQTVYSALYRSGEFDFLGQLKTVSDQTTFAKSVAVRYHPQFLPMATVSFGRKEFAVINTIKSSLTLGFSLNMFDTSFDYAYETSEHIEYDGKHYFSVGYYF